MEVFTIFHQIPSYLNAYASGPFPRKEGERGSVVKEKNPFSIERYGAPAHLGKGSGVRSDLVSSATLGPNPRPLP